MILTINYNFNHFINVAVNNCIINYSGFIEVLPAQHCSRQSAAY